MGRRTDQAAERAAVQASEAARTLAVRSHEARQERTPEPEVRTEPQVKADPERIEKLLKNRPHSQSMDEIVEKRGLNEKPEAVEKVEPKAEPKTEPKAEPEPEIAAAPPVEAVEPVVEAPKTVRVKVDGEEYDAPADEVEAAGGIKAYQREKASENRLKKANETLAETRKLQGQMAEWVQANAKPAAPQPTDDEFIKSKIDVIRFGTPEESAAAMREVLQRGAPKPVDQNAIINQAVSTIHRQQAVAEFAKEFQDIVSNPLLARLAVSLEIEEIGKAEKEGRPVDWRKAYSKIGTQVRSIAPPRQSQPAATPDKTASSTSQPSEKEVRKASIVNLPTASARAELPKEEKQQSPEEARKEAILAMKKSRGIPTG